jgi:endoglucanase
MLAFWLLLAALPAAAEGLPTPLEAPGYYRGVNLAGAEFGARALPGRHGHDYVYPILDFASGYEEPAFLVRQGVDLFRLPVRWERLQPELFGPLDPAEAARLDRTLSALRALGAHVVLDVHNYARYHGDLIGSEAVPTAAFVDLWQRLARRLPADPGLILGLMNEPHGLPPGDWVDIANAAIAGIREAGAGHVVAVPGTRWSGAHSWLRPHGEAAAAAAAAVLAGEPAPPVNNAEALLGVVDPIDNYVIEVHQYLDDDSSGRSGECVAPEQAARRMDDFTEWLIAHDRRGFLGEIGAGNNPNCLEALYAVLSRVAAARDHWLGVAYWAAGPWWDPGYHFLLEPGNAADPRLVRILGH